MAAGEAEPLARAVEADGPQAPPPSGPLLAASETPTANSSCTARPMEKPRHDQPLGRLAMRLQGPAPSSNPAATPPEAKTGHRRRSGSRTLAHGAGLEAEVGDPPRQHLGVDVEWQVHGPLAAVDVRQDERHAVGAGQHRQVAQLEGVRPQVSLE